jgi:hypothetical protein
MAFLDDLKGSFEELKRLRSDVKKETCDRINRRDLRDRAEGLASEYFSNIKPFLEKRIYIEKELINQYTQTFERLLKLISRNNRKSSYSDVLDQLIAKYKEDLIIPVSTHPEEKVEKGFISLFGELAQFPEKEYLTEAIGCAENGFTRAAVVLGWSAAVYRFHSVIEKIGFSTFNSLSARICGESQGRFKRFSKAFNIRDRNEMNEVFDTDLLWVMEGMGLIDMNDHTRLRSCFDLRCQGAHPCNAPFTDYNLLSFFSDIREIVFNNSKFQL